MPEVGLGYLEEGINAYIRNYERTSIFNDSTTSPRPQTQQPAQTRPTQIPTTPSSTAKRAHSPDEPSTSKIPRRTNPVPSETPSVPQPSKKKQSAVKTVSSIGDALPKSPKNPTQMRLDDLVAGRIEAVDWIMLDEAQEVKRQLGDKAYKQWIEYVLKNSKRKLVVVFRTLSNGHWTYGDGKRKAWIPWMDTDRPW